MDVDKAPVHRATEKDTLTQKGSAAPVEDMDKLETLAISHNQQDLEPTTANGFLATTVAVKAIQVLQRDADRAAEAARFSVEHVVAREKLPVADATVLVV